MRHTNQSRRQDAFLPYRKKTGFWNNILNAYACVCVGSLTLYLSISASENYMTISTEWANAKSSKRRSF
jgi:hypothetical protein